MWFLVVVAVASLFPSPTHCGVKELGLHFDLPELGDVKPVPLEEIPTDYHKENTLTNTLLDEELDEEDYIDFDKLLAEDDDYIDMIDEIESPATNVDVVIETTDPQIKRAKLHKLFQGKSRIQRLNIVNADFGFNLYRSLRNGANQSDNILLAPVGISTIMGMIDLGTKEQTHQQIFNTLGFEDFVNASSKYEDATIHNLFRKLTHRLFRRNFGYTLRSVNDLYVESQHSLVDAFRNNIKNYYFAEAQSVDFKDPSFLVKTNQRVSKLTKNLIKEALKTVNPDTLMMILNCLYFKGTWENKFPADLTHHRNFRLNDKESVKVSMMQTKGNFLAAADHDLECDVLQLPYVGNIYMLIVIPRKLSGMRSLERQLSSEVVSKWVHSMTNRTREVVFPKFKLQKNYNLIGSLKELGLTDLFEGNANFSGMTDQKIAIDMFNHQGTITVNEEGTEAAAVTKVGFMPLSAQIRFIVDRPFLFLIYEQRTNCLLFMGRVANPAKD
ncbi:heparin cofactor 2-like [Polyodon spathula]|uniref:heparin cofactor 2-like n=1 Tax=Polyodon spathula TaxID=7913 RepID=UPI001B7DF29F|nr:heparin cofactor 2-like [Polyodon spathula]XP_041078562.1 heparin cofactor 2-like [Polyodon spathula]